MQLSIDLKTKDIISLISQMSLNELEKVKNSLIERELYFKEFKKDNVGNIIDDFKKEDYSNDFLTDLEEGLKKSSVYKWKSKKYEKAKKLFENDTFYPSLNTELLEPKDRLIYSFRLDRKYRALFIYIRKNEIEIITFTNHYKW